MKTNKIDRYLRTRAAAATAVALTMLTGFAVATHYIYDHVEIDDPYYAGNQYLFVSGAFKSGSTHTIYDHSDPSLTAGSALTTYGSGVLNVGNNNNITGPNSSGLGEGLIVSNGSPRTAVGSYNIDVTDAKFIVGNGDSNSDSNALVVYNDGRVVIPTPQGDIPIYVPTP